MRVVVSDRRFGSSFGRYTLDVKIHYPGIPSNLPLTSNVLRQYRECKSPLGYAPFRGLGITDIHSILSAVKRREAIVNVDRMGNCAFYKLTTK